MRRIIVFLLLSACTSTDEDLAKGTPDNGQDTVGDTGGAPFEPTTPVEAGSRDPGQSCTCDADCADGAGGANPGACVWGVCMTAATGACASAGSQGECPDGSRCWNLTGTTSPVCWPDCDAHTCDGVCDEDGSCAPTDASQAACSNQCAELCPCTPGTCGDGFACVDGACVMDPGGAMGPGAGPGPDCPDLPAMGCTGTAAQCAVLTSFSPRTTPAYDDYPINGETTANQYRSFLRRDFVDLLEYATAKTLCKTAAWTYGNGGPLGLGDMSEANGAIPGTSIGSPGHPASTHVNGRDIDLGYYQVGTSNNRLRPVCEHSTASGQDAYHCTGEPTLLDVYRMAMFLGVVFESPRVRVIGVDGKVGPLIEAAIDELCEAGWLTEYACTHVSLAYEVTDGGSGWFSFHHHHAHISLKNVATSKPARDTPAGRECMDPDGCERSLKAR